MSEYNPTLAVLAAFAGEMQKGAALTDVVRTAVKGARTNGALAGAGSGLGLGLGAGMVGGGALGGVRSYREAREQGSGRLAALGSSLGGAAKGALRGGAVGAAVGAAGGAALGAMDPRKARSLTSTLAKREDSVGSFSRFGQRQVHSLTGWKPGGSAKSVESIGAGAAPARAEVQGAIDRLGKSKQMDDLMAVHAAGGDPAALEKAREALRQGPQKELGQAYKSLGAAEKAQQMGLTSLPGYVKSVGREGLLPTLKAGLQQQWQSNGTKGRALMVGMPALSIASTLHKPEEGTRGKGESVGRLAGGALGMMAAPLPMAGSMLLGSAMERAGGAVGKGVDRLRGYKPTQVSQVPKEPSRPPATAPGDTGQVAVEREFGTGYGGAGGLE